MSSFGTKIVEGRKKKGMSQEAFSDRMGVTRQTVSKWELDISSPRLKKIKKISEILDISVEELLAEKSEKKSNDGPVATNSFNYKKLIKGVAIAVLILLILYVCYSAYKLIVLNSISSKLRQYMNVDNYYFKMESLVDGALQSTNEVWYKDGNYKIIETFYANDIESSTTTYLDMNNNEKYIVNEEDNTYTSLEMFRTENYENGAYMYSLFPAIIKKEFTNFFEYGFKLDFVLCTIHKNKITLKVNDEEIKFDKETGLPIDYSLIMKTNKNMQKNDVFYLIELNNVLDTDVKLPQNYLLLN